MPSLPQDLRFALRTMRRGRLVSLCAIVSLALGIAGNAYVFSLIDAFIFRPLPYPESDRIVVLGQRQEAQPDLAALSLTSALSVWADYRERSRSLAEWAAFSPRFVSLSGPDRSVSVSAARVTTGFFELLGAGAARGRSFTAEEGAEGGPDVVVLSWEYWQNVVGAEKDPVGTVIRLDGEPHRVIGVLPQGFEFIVPDIRLWLPLQADPHGTPRNRRNVVSLARMADGVTMAQVDAEVAAIARGLAREHPQTLRGWTLDAMNLRTEIPDPQSRLYMVILQAAVLLALLVACANIASLLLARSRERRREIAVRVALGAGRLRILAQHLRESMVIAAVGGAAGLVLAAVAIRHSAERLAPVVVRSWRPGLDAGVVLFALGVTVLSGLVFGLFPALQSFRDDQLAALQRGGAGRPGATGRPGRVAAGLVVAEIALSLVALGGAGVLVRSFLDLRTRDPGFEPENLLTVRFQVPDRGVPTAGEIGAMLDRVRDDVAALPGVGSAALVTPLPQSLFPRIEPFGIGERPPREGESPHAVSVWASPAYLETMAIALLRGRFFRESDRWGAPPVAVVNRSLAERRFGGGEPVGERITFQGQTREIVGVVGDVQQSLVPVPGEGSPETISLPMAQGPRSTVTLVARTVGDPRGQAERARRAIWNIDPDLTIDTVETMVEFTGTYTVAFDLFNLVLGGFGAFTLLLASLGTYGLVAYTTARRTHEVGVRLALGARPREVVTMVALHGVRMALAGLSVGALLLVPVVRILDGLLEQFALAPAEPLGLVGVGVALLAVTLVASVVPASRAAGVAPALVLKVE